MGHAHEAEYVNAGPLGQMEKGYIRTWGILCGLFVISVLGPELGIWWLTLITAFGIAVVKAWLVIRDFMHIPMEQPVIHYILITCLAFMGLFFAGVSTDVMNHHGSRWVNVAAIEAVERGMAAGEAGGHGHHGEADHGAAAGDHGEAAGDHGAAEGDHGGGH